MDKIPSTLEMLNILIPQKPYSTMEENLDSENQNIENLRNWVNLHVTKALTAVHKQLQLPDEDLDFTLSAYSRDNIE